MTVALLALLLAQGLTPEVIEHAQAGTEAMKLGHFEVAVEEFRKVTTQQPDSASGHANLGEAYLQSQDFAAAIPELRRAVELNPQMIGTHQSLGIALLIEGNAAEALPHLEKVRTPELLGLAYLETGRLGSAIMALQAALERQPGDPDLLYFFGRATGLAAKRISDQLKGVKSPPPLQPEAAAPGGKDAVQEVVRLQTALAASPNDPALLTGFRRAAELASRQVFDKIPADSGRAHQVSAERLADSGRLPEAEKEYMEAVRLQPYASGVHLALGDILAAEDKGPAAIAQYRAEADLRPLSAETLYRLGYTLLRQGQAQAARAALQRADELQPNTQATLLELGRASLAADDAAQAEQSWTKLLGIESSGEFAAQAHFGLAAMYRNAGKLAEAQRETNAYEQLKKQESH
jgi:tetratricopeptide (TPR) repeat protein